MFRNRTEAGQLLAERLRKYGNTDAIVLAIPRGGVPVGLEISKALRIPLDIILAKKIGHPLNEEYAIGSVSLDAVIIEDHPEIDKQYALKKAEELRLKLQQRLKLLRGDKPLPGIENKTVILTDDGIATGNTMLACLQTLRKNNPSRIVVAVPVSPPRSTQKIEDACDEFISLEQPEYFPGVGAFYDDFPQVNDEEVIRALKEN